MNQEQYDKLMAVIAQASNAADDMRRKWEAHGMNSMSELAAVRQRQCNEAFDIVMTLYAESNLTSPEAFATNPHRMPEPAGGAVVDAEFADPVVDTPGAIHYMGDDDRLVCGASLDTGTRTLDFDSVTCRACLAAVLAPQGQAVS